MINLNDAKFTDRSIRILKYAEQEAKKTTKLVYPIHLLLGALQERTGVCAELFITYPKLIDILFDRVYKIQSASEEQNIHCPPFNMPVSLSVKNVLADAILLRERYKQNFINEGHLIKAIFAQKDPLTTLHVKGLDHSLIIKITSATRDMIVSLANYSYPRISETTVKYRKAEKDDAISLKSFVEKEFGSGWIESIENGLQAENIPIYVATENEKLIGFACYDVYQRKKGLFGPMGVAMSNRIRGVGYTLLHYCLKEMQEKNYAYAIISEAGPIEFYEKACGAIVIPNSELGKERG